MRRKKKKCEDSPDGLHHFSPDLEYDSTGETINCEHCGKPEKHRKSLKPVYFVICKSRDFCIFPGLSGHSWEDFAHNGYHFERDAIKVQQALDKDSFITSDTGKKYSTKARCGPHKVVRYEAVKGA